jgi:hypothetical protein
MSQPCLSYRELHGDAKLSTLGYAAGRTISEQVLESPWYCVLLDGAKSETIKISGNRVLCS